MIERESADPYAAPVTGAELARDAWQMSSETLSSLLGADVPDSEHEEVRGQFVAWAIAHSARTYPDGLWQAWDEFVSPKAGVNAPVVLLPGSRCTDCSAATFAAGKTVFTARADCVTCRGTGRTRPRLLPARVSSRATPVPEVGTEIA